MPKAKKAASKKPSNASNDQIKKLKAQMADLKKKAAEEKKTLTAKLKDQKAELTAKMAAATSAAYTKGYETALADINKFNAARDKALSAAAKKFDSKNKIKAPVATKAKKTAKKKSAPKKKVAAVTATTEKKAA